MFPNPRLCNVRLDRVTDRATLSRPELNRIVFAERFKYVGRKNASSASATNFYRDKAERKGIQKAIPSSATSKSNQVVKNHQVERRSSDSLLHSPYVSFG